MITETIKQEQCFIHINKYGEYVPDSEHKVEVEYEIEYVEDLPLKIVDFIKMLKRDGTIDFSMTFVNTIHMIPKIEKKFFNLEFFDKITFKEYYMEFGSYKVFYDAIFDFSKATRW